MYGSHCKPSTPEFGAGVAKVVDLPPLTVMTVDHDHHWRALGLTGAVDLFWGARPDARTTFYVVGR